MESVSKTFCILPWTHFTTSATGSTSLCCYNMDIYDPAETHSRLENGGYINEGVENIWNSSYFKNARKAMLAGEKVASHLPMSPCEKCYADERGGVTSVRQIQNSQFTKKEIDTLIEKTSPDGYLNELPVDFRIFIGSTCNLQCMMCFPDLSSALISVHRKIATIDGWLDQLPLARFKNRKDPYKNPLVWKETFDPVLKNIHTLQIVGGEPLVIKAHYDLLKYCVDKKYSENISIILNTNGTTIPSDDLVEMWSKFKEVKIQLSIDDIKERNEYIRYPAKWDDMLKFIEFIENTSLNNIKATFFPTIQVANIYYIPDFFDWIIDQQFSVFNNNSMHNINEPGISYMNILEDRRQDNIKSLSPKVKKIVEQKCSSWYNKISQLEEIIGYMHTEDWHDEHYYQFTNWHKKLDMIRGTDFYQTFPIFREFDT